MHRSKLPFPILVFTLTFFYVLFAGGLIQFVVLPYVFPDLHAGDGLLKGFDTVGFHQDALKLFAEMNVKGWSAWSLRPDGMNSPPGIMAALYYLLIPKPYVFLILNAVLWGITAATWFAILKRIFPKNGHWSMIPVLVIVALPSSLQWTSQFLKDIFCITGISLIFYAFIHTVVYQEGDIAKWVRGLGIPLLLGSVLIWIVRPYMLQLLVAGSLATLPVVGLAYLLRRAPRGLMTTTVAVTILTLLFSFVGNTLMSVKDERHDRLNLAIYNPGANIWSHFFDGCVLRLMYIRQGYCASKDKVGGAIDCEMEMLTTEDAIAYFPRALAIAMLSPFPNIWFGKAKTPGGRQMRLIAGIEMLGAYAVFLLTFILFIRHRIRFSLPVVLSITYLLTPLLIETYANPEIGTLYRMRYVFWTGLIAIFLSLIMEYFLFFKQERIGSDVINSVRKMKTNKDEKKDSL